jgi:toxin ParE1/3/4
VPSYILDQYVEDELWEIWSFIAKDNPQAAADVVEAVHDTLKLLASNPRIGKQRAFRNPRLKDIRSFPVSGYGNYVIFYRIVADGVQAIRVYHGARNLDGLFKDEAVKRNAR